MDVTYRIPSKKVPYGYIEFTWKREAGTGMPDPTELAEEYAQYIKDYQSAEVQAFENPTARQLNSKPARDEVAEATRILTEGLGPVSEVDGDDPAAPWNKTSDNTTNPSEESPSSAVDDSDWDFG